MSSYDYSKNKKCELCGKPIANRATLCKTCSNKSRKGKIFTEKQKKNMSIAQLRRAQQLDYIPGFWGKHHTLEMNKHLHPKGENSHNWKGENVGYAGVHEWVRKYKPKPMLCEECNKKEPIDLANISGEYKRDINDYRWLCRKCHQESDGRLKNRNKKGQFKAKCCGTT